MSIRESKFPGEAAHASDELGALLLRHADRSFAPPPAAESAVWRGVEGALAVASLAPLPLATAPAQVASLAPQKLALAFSWKAGLGLLALGLLGTVPIYLWSRGAPPAPAAVAVPTVASTLPPGLAVNPLPAAPLEPSEVAPALLPAPAPVASPALTAAVAVPRAASTTPAASAPAPEAATLLEARRAIRTGETARALALLESVSPKGALAEEREVLTIEALAPGDLPRAQKRAAQFLRQHPQSPYRGRVEAVLAR